MIFHTDIKLGLNIALILLNIVLIQLNVFDNLFTLPYSQLLIFQGTQDNVQS